MRRRLLPDACGRRVSWSESVHVARRELLTACRDLLSTIRFQKFGV